MADLSDIPDEAVTAAARAKAGLEERAASALADAERYREAQDPMLASALDLELKKTLLSALMEAEQLCRRDADAYARYAKEYK